MQVIVVTLDRLATRLLGCYGNEWIETPSLDRLATTGVVFENHFADTVGPHSGLAWLTGQHAICSTQGIAASSALCQTLRAAGVSTRVICCRASNSRFLEEVRFDRHQSVEGQGGLNANPAEVPFAKLVQAAIASFNDTTFQCGKRLLWLHAPEPGLPPEGFATLYFEDFEERGVSLADVPREQWGEQYAAAAGSASLIDHWLGVLLQELWATSRDRPTLVIIAAAAGRSWMNDFLKASPTIKRESPVNFLREQEVRSPVILSVRNDNRSSDLTGLRCRHFVQPMDLLPTLLDWFGVESSGEPQVLRSWLRLPLTESTVRDAVVVGDEARHLGIRTRSWYCLTEIASAEGLPDQVQLFVKPDDIWDVTDVSTQYPEICEDLLHQMCEITRPSSEGQSVRR